MSVSAVQGHLGLGVMDFPFRLAREFMTACQPLSNVLKFFFCQVGLYIFQDSGKSIADHWQCFG